MRNLKSNKRHYTVVAFAFFIIFFFLSFSVLGQIEQNLGKRSRSATNVEIEQNLNRRSSPTTKTDTTFNFIMLNNLPTLKELQVTSSFDNSSEKVKDDVYPPKSPLFLIDTMVDASLSGDLSPVEIISPGKLEVSETVVVPQLVGAPWNYKQVSEFLTGMRLKLGTATPVVDNEHVGIITNQSLPIRTFVPPFTVINITYGIQGAPQIVDVPQYIGLNSDNAIRNIQNDYLSLGKIRMMESDYPVGMVIDQFPTQGMKVDPGTRINLDISQGPPAVQTVVVPQLKGLLWNRQQIFDLLKETGLLLGTITPVVNNQAIGRIVNQDPVAQTRVPPSTSINLTYGIQATPDLVIVGRYTGLNREIAIQRLQNDRLIPGNVSEELSEEPAGVVINQFPKERMEVNSGTRINLVISLGPPEVITVAVPQLIGHSMNESAEILKSVGLFAGQFSSKSVADKKPGTVIEQSPPAGTVVNKNSSVNITFSVIPANVFVVVPNVTGMWRDNAIRTLKESKLNYAIVYVKNFDENVGIVVGQSISQGKEVPPGTSVVIEIQDEKTLPPWIYWGGAILLAGVLGGSVMKRKIKAGERKKKIAKKNIKLKLNLVWDNGEQTVSKGRPDVVHSKLNLKYISDKGKQNLKID